jgi:hypothetical protein
MLSSGMLYHMALVTTDVSVERNPDDGGDTFLRNVDS